MAIKLLDLILNKENLMGHLGNLNEYLFIKKGDFFQVLIEESRSIMMHIPNSNSENEFNNNVLQNVIFCRKNYKKIIIFNFKKTLRRLNKEESKDMKSFSFKIKKEGFEYNHFSNTAGLNIIGEVILRSIDQKYIRFEQMRNQKQSGGVKYIIIVF